MTRLRRPQIALIGLLALLMIGYAVNAVRTHHPAGQGTVASAQPAPGSSTAATATGTAPAVPGTVALSSLPKQAGDTVELIRKGGPFPYSQDGVVFSNNERRLPDHPGGYYHEYTVVTPGSPDRGARRIITGRHGEYYYTDDHYETFVPVDVSR